MPLESLAELADILETDKCKKYHNYVEFYETAFQGLREKQLKILEIGILKGESIQLWRRAFRNSQIYGADIDQVYLDHIATMPNVTPIFLNQTDSESLDNTAKFGPFDIIIDDGIHTNLAQLLTWDKLWPQVNPGGWYIIEDRHIGYREEFKGLKRRRSQRDEPHDPNASITDFFTDILFELALYGKYKFSNYKYYPEVPSTYYQRTISHITFTPGLIAIKKRDDASE